MHINGVDERDLGTIECRKSKKIKAKASCCQFSVTIAQHLRLFIYKEKRVYVGCLLVLVSTLRC